MSRERLAAFMTVLVFILAATGAAYACYVLVPSLLSDKATSVGTVIILIGAAALVIVPVALVMIARKGAK